MLDDLRSQAATDPDGVRIKLEALKSTAGLAPQDLYLLAQLTARTGSLAVAVELVAEAETAFRSEGDSFSAARCDSGRSTLLHALGRHDESIQAATRWLDYCERNEEVPAQMQVQALSNLAVYLHAAGRYTDAVTSLDRAGALLGDADERLSVALKINRAASLNMLGRCPEALEELLYSIEVLRRTGESSQLSVAAINAGETLHRMGRPDEGLNWFDTAAELIDADDPTQFALFVETGSALLDLGATAEASVQFQSVANAPTDRTDATLQARAWHGLAICLATQGKNTQATEAFATASLGYKRAGNLPDEVLSAAQCLAVSSPDLATSRVLHMYDSTRQLIDGLGVSDWPIHRCQSLIHLGLFALRAVRRTDDVSVSERWLEDAYIACDIARSVEIPGMVAQAGHVLGTLLLFSGRVDDAEGVIRESIAAADSIRSGLQRDRILALSGDVATTCRETLTEIEIRRGHLDAALDATDSGRSSATTVLVSKSADRDAHLGRLRAELSGLFDRMVRSDVPLSNPLRIGLNDRARQIEREIDRRELTVSSALTRLPEKPLPAQEKDTVALVYRIVGNAVDCFVRQQGTVTLHRAIANLDAVTNALAAFHSAGRRSLAAASLKRPVHEPTAAAVVQRYITLLSDALIKPLLASLPDLTTLSLLTVVPHGPLHAVPFHALTANGLPLACAAPIVATPSLRVQESRPPAADGPFVIVGYDTGDLPGVYREVETIASVHPDARVLIDRDATSEQLRKALPGASGVHVATHGLFRAESPWHSGLRLADGWLSADDVMSLPLAGMFVVLSACETGSSLVAQGDELLGLQRAFFQAGVTNLFTSMWGAVDEVAVDCSVALHSALRNGLKAAGAAQHAQLTVRERFANPWWWSTFGLAGSGR